MAQRGAAVHRGMTLPANSRLRQNGWGQTVMRLSGPNHMRMRGRQQHAAYLPSATATLAAPEVGFGREPRDPRGHGPANHRNVGDSDAQSHGDERRPHGDVHGGQGKHDDDRDDGEASIFCAVACAGVILCGCSGMAPETKPISKPTMAKTMVTISSADDSCIPPLCPSGHDTAVSSRPRRHGFL